MSHPTAGPLRHALATRARAVVETRWFTGAVLFAILGNAVVLGLETYSGLSERWREWLLLGEGLFLAAFTVEIVLRAAAFADRPARFFRDPWNVFDLVVVVLAHLPLMRENATLLRLLRLARVLRAARLLPQLRIILVAIAKSVPGTFSFLMVGALLLYLYAMLGWMLYAEHDPDRYGSLGRALLTLFLLTTLDGLGPVVHEGLEYSRWSVLYYGTFVLLASFVLVNMLIGVVINSLDEARAVEAGEAREPGEPRTAGGGFGEEELRAKIAEARRVLDELEAGLRR
ncbi:ion transporter [Streptomyces alkaliterrae]|uniref:Ion transporter n=1 Tax=Streptomyces alkaliterrae TaxID=2213162 RepID=A0A5P0YV79_9ACTN|nr:ion transporter [Streptomyces alkaliterrae]MBB1260654.1 ion transporter [Streptomyces alkaliterrae]MQS03507.1 ion transporter [Streptomyces alkaliterrae]